MTVHWRRFLVPLAGVVWFWVELTNRDLGAPFSTLGDTAALVAIVTAAVVVGATLAVVEETARVTLQRRVAVVVLVAAVAGACLAVPGLRVVALAALVALFWILLFRSTPRAAVVLFAVASTVPDLTPYFGLVLVGVGVLLVPGSLAEYLREVVPRRIGGVP